MAKTGRGLGRWPGVADRFRQRLRELGYWDDERGRPQRMRFADDHGYELMYVMGWLDGKQPSYENLLRLARDLDVTPAWLLFGDDGGRELVNAATTSAAPKRSRASKRSRAGRIVGAVALFGASLFPALAMAVPDQAGANGYYVKRRRKVAGPAAAAAQLALDLAAA